MTQKCKLFNSKYRYAEYLKAYVEFLNIVYLTLAKFFFSTN